MCETWQRKAFSRSMSEFDRSIQLWFMGHPLLTKEQDVRFATSGAVVRQTWLRPSKRQHEQHY
jgi:hypothetical protein